MYRDWNLQSTKLVNPELPEEPAEFHFPFGEQSPVEAEETPTTVADILSEISKFGEKVEHDPLLVSHLFIRCKGAIQEVLDMRAKMQVGTWIEKGAVAKVPHPLEVCSDNTDTSTLARKKFRIEKVNAEAKMWAKQFSTDEFWLPSEGIKHLKAEPEADKNILSSEQHPLKAYSKLKKSSLEGPDLDLVKSVESIHLNLQSNCYKYFNALDIEWWENFFLEQLDLGTHIKSGSRAPLMEVLQFPGARPIPSSSSAIEPDEAQASRPVLVELEETRDEVFGSRREIYTSGHRFEPWSVAHAKKHHLGDLNELKVSSLIAVVCEDDELKRPFWIAKVINI
ncbi:hypothetical protein R1sor_013150 [Riccia sorocarpa]|uniref:Uncharacterized protein n=1 Tax=Riccia sorocarpa TaxID=122646 RepID=A0ABD3H7K8_9MARC